MHRTINNFLLKVIPFLALGVFVVLLIFGIIFFSYLLILGAVVGLILFCIAWVANKLSHKNSQRINIKSSNGGRTIDEDKKKNG